MRNGIKAAIFLLAALLTSCTATVAPGDISNSPTPSVPPIAPDGLRGEPDAPLATPADVAAVPPPLYEVRGDAADSLERFSPDDDDSDGGGILLPFEDAAHQYGFCDLSGRVAVHPVYHGVRRLFYGNGPGDWLYDVAINERAMLLASPDGGVLYRSDDGARVCESYSDNGAGYVILTRNGLFSALRVDRRFNTGFVFENAPRFSEGLAAVMRNGETAYQYIDAGGEVALFGPFDFAGAFSEGMAVVCYQGLWGVVGRDGQWVTPPVYDHAQSFGGGVFAAQVDGLWGLVDRAGSAVFPFDYTSVDRVDADVYLLTRDSRDNSNSGGGDPQRDGGSPDVLLYYDAQTARVVEAEGVSYLADGVWQRVLDNRVELVLEREKTTEAIYGASGVRWIGLGLLEADTGGAAPGLYRLGHGFLPGTEGMALSGFWAQDGLLTVYKDGRYGLLNLDGEILLPCEYEDIRPLGGGYCAVRQNGCFGVMDTRGGWILRLKA